MTFAKLSVALTALCAISACSTPRTVLKNPETGQVATCGGGTTGSIAGGVIGYEVEKSSDRECVETYQGLGFSVVTTQ